MYRKEEFYNEEKLKQLQENYTEILSSLGEDPQREGDYSLEVSIIKLFM